MNITDVKFHSRPPISGSRLINHEATVMVEGYTPEQHGALVNELSIRAGYHPAGYGVYGSSVTPTDVPNKYVVTWSTGSSCD